MSQLRLYDSLIHLFETKSSSSLAQVLTHPEYSQFIDRHHLEVSSDQLVRSFTHASFSHEYQVPNQETLEFLGDAVLQLIITDMLLEKFPGEKEGRLSRLRSTIVNEKSLATLALALNLEKLILVGKGEFKKDLFTQEVVLADTVEALIGAIHQAQSFDKTKKLVLEWFQKFLPEAFALSALDEFDAKSKLQEASLAKYKVLPRYSAEAQGTQFLVKVWINEQLMAEGLYPSKKSGEMALAKKVLKENSY